MPRKPKTTSGTVPVPAQVTAAPAPKKRAAPKKSAALKVAPAAKTAAPLANKTAPPAPTAKAAPKRAAKPKAPAKRISAAKSNGTAAKSNGTAAASRAAKVAAFDTGSYHEDIARLAYHFWEQRGQSEGSPEQDWLRAEHEFRRTVLVDSI